MCFRLQTGRTPPMLTQQGDERCRLCSMRKPHTGSWLCQECLDEAVGARYHTGGHQRDEGSRGTLLDEEVHKVSCALSGVSPALSLVLRRKGRNCCCPYHHNPKELTMPAYGICTGNVRSPFNIPIATLSGPEPVIGKPLPRRYRQGPPGGLRLS